MAIRGRTIGAGAAGVTVAVTLAFTLITGFEGRVNHVYPDPVTKGAPWTYCDGETQNPKWNHVYTDAECDAETLSLVVKYDQSILQCMMPRKPLPPKVEAAFVSLAWNIGIGAFCKSSTAKAAHDGDLKTACEKIALYNRAGGRKIPGLVFRRGEEVAFCLDGLK